MTSAGGPAPSRPRRPAAHSEERPADDDLGGILIVDDHKLFADAIRAALLRHHYRAREPVGTGAEAVAEAERYRPEVALVDIGLPDTSGVQVGRRIMEVSPETRVVVVTAMDDQRVADEVVRAGFHGYLLKDTKMSQLLSAIQIVLNGEVVLPTRGSRMGGRARAPEARLLGRNLTPRELEVLEMLARGVGGREIARELGVAPNTVRTHVQSILSKLQVHSRLEAAAFAVRHGLVRPAQRT
jgi:two-component system nitrate/nitrite response regulator NarL